MARIGSRVPGEADPGLPSAARVCDYLLGGGHHFAADRALAREFLLAQPNARTIVRLDRSFLRRAVLHLIDRGVRQFLDLGSGLPSVGNVHGKDVTDPRTVPAAVRRTGLLDFAEPIGVLAVGVFHFVPPECGPVGVLGVYRDALAPGSALALSQFTSDLQPAEMAGIVEVMRKSPNPVFPRTHAEITALFDGFEVVEPGVVPLPRWRPEEGVAGRDDPDRAGIFAGVGHKR
ncbi:SAM-dependent methyltransferase [Saccharothrix mutabilis subsp. mutabilis]|uniref:SAM-dependent methyltransferase n=1 Tax=Saccharothrix mutabilis subsp. mutabilis TaxID=66855 RepID=A0ABP3EEJ8_9PSEU